MILVLLFQISPQQEQNIRDVSWLSEIKSVHVYIVF